MRSFSNHFIETCSSSLLIRRGRRGRGRILAGFTTTYAIKCLSPITRGVLDSPFSSTNKTDRQDIAEILLKVALNTITLTLLIRPLSSKATPLIRSNFIYTDKYYQIVSLKRRHFYTAE